MDSHRIALIIPTKDRPDDLRRLLTSVQAQSVQPHEIVIVDGSNTPSCDPEREFPSLNIRYVREFPPSVARQRNAGIRALSSEATLVGQLDDDLVLEHDALESMMRFWAHAPADVGGASFNIVNNGPPRGLLVKSLFRIDSRRKGAVLRSGYQTSVAPVRDDIMVEWLCGGATVWRRQVAKEFRYDEWFSGYSFLEDVEYSYRVSRHYRLAVVATARVTHLSGPIRQDRNYAMGKCQIINRRYFISRHPNLSVPLFYWGTVGLIIANVGEAVATRNHALLKRACGNAMGLFSCSLGHITPETRALKD